MFFRVAVGVPELRIIDGPISFELTSGGSNVHVVLRDAPVEDAHYPNPPYFVTCEATAEIKPSKAAAPLIDAIWQKRIPDGYDMTMLSEEKRRAYEEQGQIEGELRLSALPNVLQNLIHNAYGTINDSINTTIGTLCWRTAQVVPIYHYYRGRMRWSVDGQQWRFSPADFKVWMGRPPFVFGLASRDISDLLQSENTPPFSRELFREAWSHKDTNPRSSLVIGVAALETGVKDLIIGLLPDTEWLIRNLPAPPVHRMLGEYLAVLQAKNQQVFCPSTEIVKNVQKWILKRNELSHGKSATIEIDDLTNFLMLISDLLYACDYARGVTWALDLIRPETRLALGVVDTLNSDG